MSKSNLQRWHELQQATVSNSNGYMSEFISSENPLRTGSHVFTEIANVEPSYNKLQRMTANGVNEVISLEDFREDNFNEKS